jgi:hypothetical protein
VRDVSLAGAEAWIREHVEPVGPVEVAHERPWSTVLRVPIAQGIVWFKACAQVQAFEPRLSAELSARWPDRVAQVIAHDEDRAWLLTTDAGTPMRASGNSPTTWLAALPVYAELQRGETPHAHDHLVHAVPDLRLSTLPSRYEALLDDGLPLDDESIARLRAFAPRLVQLCQELDSHGIPDSIQHDDLHHANVYEDGERLRILDWGDSSIAHPFTSLVVTFRFLDELNKLPPDDPWFTRLRDAYLEPWGDGLTDAFDLAIRVGAFSHAVAWMRQREHLPDGGRADFDRWFRVILERALARTRK